MEFLLRIRWASTKDVFDYVHGEQHTNRKEGTAKGTKKSVTKRQMRHASYKECLFDKKQTMVSRNLLD